MIEKRELDASLSQWFDDLRGRRVLLPYCGKPGQNSWWQWLAMRVTDLDLARLTAAMAGAQSTVSIDPNDGVSRNKNVNGTIGTLVQEHDIVVGEPQNITNEIVWLLQKHKRFILFGPITAIDDDTVRDAIKSDQLSIVGPRFVHDHDMSVWWLSLPDTL